MLCLTRIDGIAFTLIMLAIALVMKYPPTGWRPSGWNHTVNTAKLPAIRHP